MKDEFRCTATAKSTGKRCGAPAIRGATVCSVHGGMAGQVRRKAAERLALAEALEKAARRPAWEVLGDALHTSDVLAQRAANTATDDEPGTVVNLVHATERAARLAKTALDSGVDERRLRAYEERVYADVAGTFVGVVERVLASLHLTPEQSVLANAAMVQELKAVMGTADPEEAPDAPDDAA